MQLSETHGTGRVNEADVFMKWIMVNFNQAAYQSERMIFLILTLHNNKYRIENYQKGV